MPHKPQEGPFCLMEFRFQITTLGHDPAAQHHCIRVQNIADGGNSFSQRQTELIDRFGAYWIPLLCFDKDPLSIPLFYRFFFSGRHFFTKDTGRPQLLEFDAAHR